MLPRCSYTKLGIRNRKGTFRRCAYGVAVLFLSSFAVTPVRAETADTIASAPMIALGAAVVLLAFFVGFGWGRRRPAADIAGEGAHTDDAAAQAAAPAKTDDDHEADTEAHYRIISELTSDVVYAYDVAADGRVSSKWQVGGIDGLAGQTGHSDAPLAWLTQIHPDDVPILESRDQRLRLGIPSTDEFRLLSADGRVRWLRVYSRPERGIGGEVVRVVGAAKEITQDKRWEEALADSESKLQATSRTARVGYWEHFPEDNRTVCSPVLWRIWGLRPGRAGPTGKVFLDMVHPDDRSRIAAAYENPEPNSRHEYRVLRPDGSVRFVYEDLTADFDEHGRAQRLFGVAQDITERKRAEEALRDSELRYHAIVEDQTELIRRCTPDGLRTFVNEAYCQYYGVPREKLIGRPVGSELGEGEAAVRLAIIQRIGATNPIEENLHRVAGPNGKVSWQQWTERAVFDGDGRMVEIQGVGRDVTATKEAEEMLAEAKDAAEQASAAKSRFLAAASHDLRQPLQALAMFVNVLSERDLDDKAKQLINRIRDCSEALERLLGSLLDISKLDAGLFVPQRREFSLGAVIERLCSEIRPLAEEKGLSLNMVPCSLLVDSDPGLLDRLLRNLMTNAVRHTETGKILVGCRRAGPNVRVEVWDTGVGIPQGQLGMIFEEFHQVGNPARDRREGLGLGLAIVHRLSNLLDHPVDVQSWEGRGSRFGVTLPLAGEHAPAEMTLPADEHADVTGAVVVGIDDEADIREALELLLVGWGYDAIVAGSAVEAIAKLEQERKNPDLVVADYRLKLGHTGADAILAIRHVWGQDVPGFLLTGDTGPDRLREAAASGFEVMHKPIQPEKLRLMVAESIARARQGGRAGGQDRSISRDMEQRA
ncbi:MAG: PAS domain S-box protein [Rhodospirillales bacterium]